MTHDELVERVARAIHRARHEDICGTRMPWDEEDDGDYHRALARAALAAVAEAAGLRPDPDSGENVPARALEMNGEQFMLLGAEDMGRACSRTAALLRALAEAARDA